MAAKKKETEKSAPDNPPRQISVNRKSVDEVSLDYANFCSISGAPEEVILEFGITHVGGKKDEANINNRIVMNYPNAKRLIAAMTEIIRRREAMASNAEVNARKGLKPFNLIKPEEKEIQ